MPLRSDALRWLAGRFGIRDAPIYTSKFYLARESRTGEAAWWLEFPRSILDAAGSPDLHFVCQVEPKRTDFHYLRVPKEFIKTNLPRLDVRDDDRVSIFLSAEAADLFVDRRGDGKVSFTRFLMQ